MITKVGGDAIINYILGRGSSGSSSYLALLISPPNAQGSGYVEVSGNGYERVVIGRSNNDPGYFPTTYTTDIDSQTGEVQTYVSSTRQIVFPLATGAWGTITHWPLS